MTTSNQSVQLVINTLVSAINIVSHLVFATGATLDALVTLDLLLLTQVPLVVVVPVDAKRGDCQCDVNALFPVNRRKEAYGGGDVTGGAGKCCIVIHCFCSGCHRLKVHGYTAKSFSPDCRGYRARGATSAFLYCAPTKLQVQHAASAVAVGVIEAEGEYMQTGCRVALCFARYL